MVRSLPLSLFCATVTLTAGATRSEAIGPAQITAAPLKGAPSPRAAQITPAPAKPTRKPGHRFTGVAELTFPSAGPNAKLGIQATPAQWQAIMQKVEPGAFPVGNRRLGMIVRAAKAVGVPVELVLAIDYNETQHLLSTLLRIQQGGKLVPSPTLPAPANALGDIVNGQARAVGPTQYDFKTNPANARRLATTRTPNAVSAFQSALDLRHNVDTLKQHIPAADLLPYAIASWNGGVQGEINAYAAKLPPHTFDPKYVEKAEDYIKRLRTAAQAMGVSID